MRLTLRLLPPLLVVLGVLDLLLVVLGSASYAPLGRDQGIFQFTALATQRGDRLYDDLREVNGPLTHLVHRAFLALGAADVHVFRALDLGVTCVVYAVCGALLPRLFVKKARPSAAYALAAVAVLGTQYLGYLGWDQAQRESFSTWFVLLALVAAAGGAPVAAGACAAIAFFGKPTMAIYLPVCALSFGWKPWVLARFAAGAAAASVLVLGLTQWLLGGALHGLRLTLVEAPALYAELFKRGVLETLGLPWLLLPLAVGSLAAALALVAVARGVWPARFLGLAVAPLAGIVALVAQGKGYPYHAHPVTASAWLLAILALYTFHQRALAPGARASGLAAGVPAALCVLFFVAHGRWALGRSPHFFSRDIAWAARAGASERSEARLRRADQNDFHPVAVAAAADWLDAHTREDERVQIYGTEPLVLFWANRLSATPYLYEYDLDVGHALAGAVARRGPDHPRSVAIREMGLRHGADALARLARQPAAAFVLFDGSPFMTEPTALADLQKAQPALAAFLERHYRLAATFGTTVHVWERVP